MTSAAITVPLAIIGASLIVGHLIQRYAAHAELRRMRRARARLRASVIRWH